MHPTDLSNEASASDDPILKRTPESDTATEVDTEIHDDANQDVIGVSHIPSLKQQSLLRRRSISAQQSEISISSDEIVVPHGFQASDWEVNVLQILQQRLVIVAGNGEEGERGERGRRGT